ncbi:hypothetical protein [Neptunomonas concharum]|uniref:Uncharacterized protein n=1 Tax=Neptunomonas concharum TaxID=1031538 RepID=A0A5P1RBG0_9GAMM|nr:hypothetical protein [Neptunomonas concharum]QEQ96937.1 hypothetical protein F0U83_09505 [Neptunomonas concharum]
MNDLTFINAIRNKTLPPEEFGHKGHLRLAWLYLEKYPLYSAIDSICDHIQAYATALGAHDKFHRTLTVAIMNIMAHRKPRSEYASFDEFLQSNSDLIDDMEALVAKHYSAERLSDPEARHIFLAPDRDDFY